MANQWFKMYGGEFLSDPKIQGLSGDERSCWLTILCLASASTIEGRIEFLNLTSLYRMSGVNMITNDNEVDVITKFQQLKMLKKNSDGSIDVINWNKRQEKSMTGYERVKKYRQNKAILTDDNAMITPLITNDNANDNPRIEENRIEENRIENTKPSLSPSKKFIKPTLEEVKAYCEERKNGIDPQRFLDTNDAKGWLVGTTKTPMKDWKAVIRTWEGFQKNRSCTQVLKTEQSSAIVDKMKSKVIQA